MEGYCICVGYGTILKRLCEKRGIECEIQGCLARGELGNAVKHANVIVYLKDEKYDIDGLFYCDPRMDCVGFAESDENHCSWKFNSFCLPITKIKQLKIKAYKEDVVIDMRDFKSLYFSDNLSSEDYFLLSKSFSKKTLDNIYEKKNCAPIKEDKIFIALKNLKLKENEINKIKKIYYEREKYFFFEVYSLEDGNRELFREYLIDFCHAIAKNPPKRKRDCASFARYVYKYFYRFDLLSDGIGLSWTGRFFTCSTGSLSLIDESLSLKEKLQFIDKNCQIGDLLFFHRQSLNALKTTEDNCYPGHCGIYLGNHKYIDSRLTSRGDTNIVDMENDTYMANFIGFKDIITSLENVDDKIKN